VTLSKENTPPNPITQNESLQIELQLEQIEELLIGLYDLTGRRITTQTHQTTIGTNTLAMQMPPLAGLYFLSVSSEDGAQVVRKVVVQ